MQHGGFMISRTRAAAAVVTTVLLFAVAPVIFSNGTDASAAEIKVLCANGMRSVLTELHPQLERTTGQRVTMSFGEAGNLRKRIQDGEMADVIVLPRVVLDQVLTDGNGVPGTIVDLAQSSMGIGIRADAPKPDISSADGLKRAFLAAKSIAITDPATGGVSGVHIADVFKRLGIADQLNAKLKLNRGGPNAEFIAKGEAEMAVQLAHEIRMVPGVQFIPLPAEFERTFVFSAALASKAKESGPSKAVLQFLAGPDAMTVVQAKGMDPAAKK
jgi:molybdate transport system substrate-binding protein